MTMRFQKITTRRRTGSRPLGRVRCGFTLLELLMSLVLLTAFALVAGKLTYQMIHLLREAPNAETRSTADARMLEVLRADVWSARDVGCFPDRLVLVDPNYATPTTWQISADGTLTRTHQTQPDIAIPALGAGTRFETTGVGVTLVSKDFSFPAFSELRRLTTFRIPPTTTAPTTQKGDGQ